MATFGSKLKNAWNAFSNDEKERQSPTASSLVEIGGGHSHRPDRPYSRLTNERSTITPIYTRMSIDVASVEFKHAKVDTNEQYLSVIDSGLNECLNVEANIDQTGTAFRQDVATTLFEQGVAAIVPVDTVMNPLATGGYDIRSLRVGEILQWYPSHVRVSLYNEKTARREELVLPKSIVAIVTNPLYAIMNEPNSTLKRLVRKLNLIDGVDDQISSGKFNMIIKLPYVVRNETKTNAAKQRSIDLEAQLTSSKYGIAYMDAQEEIVQLNRPLDNNLLEQIDTLTKTLHSQLGISDAILLGTANEQELLNYRNRTIKPIVKAITEAMTRTFLTKTARTQQQKITFFQDPFELVPVNHIAEIGDKLIRNEILTANEFRQILGFAPAQDPKADSLRNPNMPLDDQPPSEPIHPPTPDPE